MFCLKMFVSKNAEKIFSQIKVLEEGSMFGINEFYTGWSRKLNMKA